MVYSIYMEKFLVLILAFSIGFTPFYFAFAQDAGDDSLSVLDKKEELEKQHDQRRKTLEDSHDKHAQDLEKSAARERDAARNFLERRSKELEEAYREKFSEVEKEKSRTATYLQQKEEELIEQHQHRESDARKAWEMKQLELSQQHEEKLRKLAEERTDYQRDYERRVKELELRAKRDRPHTDD